MDDVFKQVKTFRFTSGLPERMRLAESICRAVQIDLRRFVLGSVRPPSDDDVMQETLKGIATGLGKFDGNSKEEFWSWCYRIARNKISDHYRRQKKERAEPMPEHELRELMELSFQLSPPTAEMRHDLEHVMNMLMAAKPECHGYLWNHYVHGLGYNEIAEEQKISY